MPAWRKDGPARRLQQQVALTSPAGDRTAARIMPEPKYVAFPGRLVIVGFGSIGQGVLPLLLRHLDIRPDQIVVITAELRGQQVAAEYGVRFVEHALTQSDYRTVLDSWL